MVDLITIRDPDAAATVFQHPVRRRILAETAREPLSASELAERLDQPRQRLGYHVRQLAEGGFLELAERRRKRNMEETRWRATARSYVLAPDLLADVAPHPDRIADTLSATYLLALATQAQQEVADVMSVASEAGVRLLTLSLNSELYFESGAQRAAFGRALVAAVTRVVAEHTSPATESTAQPYRLVLGCYPMPPGENDDRS